MFGNHHKDAVSGQIKKKSDSTVVRKISGKWTEKTVIKGADDEETVLFDGPTIPSHIKINRPAEEQEDFESIR